MLFESTQIQRWRKSNCIYNNLFVLQVAESGQGEGWGTTDFVPVEDTVGTKSVNTYNWGDGTKEELANQTQVVFMSDTVLI
jgi:hypothetical protein